MRQSSNDMYKCLRSTNLCWVENPAIHEDAVRPNFEKRQVRKRAQDTIGVPNGWSLGVHKAMFPNLRSEASSVRPTRYKGSVYASARLWCSAIIAHRDKGTPQRSIEFKAAENQVWRTSRKSCCFEKGRALRNMMWKGSFTEIYQYKHLVCHS